MNRDNCSLSVRVFSSGRLVERPFPEDECFTTDWKVSIQVRRTVFLAVIQQPTRRQCIAPKAEQLLKKYGYFYKYLIVTFPNVHYTEVVMFCGRPERTLGGEGVIHCIFVAT